MGKFTKKLLRSRVSILVTVGVFALMVVVSYFFMNGLVRSSLLMHTKSVLDAAANHISLSLDEPRASLVSLSGAVRERLLRGDSAEDLERYISTASDLLLRASRRTIAARGFYGYFETLDGGPQLLHGDNWTPLPDDDPAQSAWYRAALEANGGVAQTVPAISGETTFTYAMSLSDDGGNRLGVVCVDVRLNSIGQEIVRTALEQEGYGILLNQELLTLAHPSPNRIGRPMGDPTLPYSVFEDAMRRGEDVSEAAMESYTGEPAVVFFRRLDNGWYLGLVTPRANYYDDMLLVGVTLAGIALVCAVILCLLLVRVETVKARSEQSNRQKSVFLANMSHEIRTPIHAIVGMTAIGLGASDAERKDYCFWRIEDASRHLLGVVNDILDMSKIEADKLALNPAAFSFAGVLAGAENVIGFRAQEKRQTLTVTSDGRIPPVLVGDDQRLTQVILNLLSNAVKFTPDGGQVALNARLLEERDGGVTISVEVSDTGVGIPPEHLARIFEPFEQGDSGTTRRFGGTGLGLVISRRIAQSMGGTISVESVPGEGSRFTFTFRAALGDPALGIPEEPQAAGGGAIPGEFAGLRLLLAEDVEINREIILAYLEDTSATVDCAENGLEALNLLEQNPGGYALALMDVQMPELDGLEATRRLRARGDRTPVVAMTANVFKEDVEKCLSAGMDGHLGKPLRMEDLLAAVRTYGRRRANVPRET